jgi:hypothetical protein
MSLIYPPAHLVYVINLKILLHRRLRRNYEFEASLSYVVRPCLKKKKKKILQHSKAVNWTFVQEFLLKWVTLVTPNLFN